jgi:glycerol-3-phosphate dehydrogenase subunit B
MNPEIIGCVSHAVVLSVEGLKDFSSRLMIEGFKKQPVFRDKTYNAVCLRSPYETARDCSAFDLASYISRAQGQEWLISEIKRAVPKGSAVLMPPLLGIMPTMDIHKRLEDELGIVCTEMSVMPPSVTGMRLRTLLMNRLKKNKVEIVELAAVTRADVENKKCRAVYTTAADQERRYVAGEYIVATGGFFGSGCIAEPGKAYESIFRIDLCAPKRQEDWSAPRLFGGEAHPFGIMGVKVNENLNALDEKENILLENVRFVGRTLGGYDFVAEKSGNGVALVTAYCAAGGQGSL